MKILFFSFVVLPNFKNGRFKMFVRAFQENKGFKMFVRAFQENKDLKGSYDGRREMVQEHLQRCSVCDNPEE